MVAGMVVGVADEDVEHDAREQLPQGRIGLDEVRSDLIGQLDVGEVLRSDDRLHRQDRGRGHDAASGARWRSVEALDEFYLAADAALTAAAGGPLVAIAPSDARSGTNALLLHPPAVIAPAFGSSSFETHLRSAEAAGAADAASVLAGAEAAVSGAEAGASGAAGTSTDTTALPLPRGSVMVISLPGWPTLRSSGRYMSSAYVPGTP